MKDKLFLIYGDEHYLIEKKINEIIEKENVTIYDMNESKIDSVIEDILSFSLFSSSKDILCTNCNFLTSSSDSKEDLNKLKDVIDKKIENRLILTVNSKVDERKKIVKELIRLSTVFVFNQLKEYEVIKYIEDRFKKYKLKIDTNTLSYFHSFVGNSLGIINNEIDKLSMYKDNDVITKEDIDAITSRTIDINIFDLIDAVVKKDINKALEMYDDFILMNEEEIKLISILGDQFRLIYQVKTMYLSGYTEEDIIKELGVHPYRIKLAKQSLITLDEAKKYLLKLYDLDLNIKTGKKDKKVAFKLFLMEN
jgi:DNA polymerase-3 subunit delta